MAMILINKIFMLLTITFYYTCAVCHKACCLFKNQNLVFYCFHKAIYNRKRFFIFNLSGKRFFILYKWRIELRFIQWNPLLWKNTEIAKGERFFCTFLSVFTLFRMGGGQKVPSYLFSPVTYRNVRISPQNFLTFSFNSFSTRV